MSKQRIYDQKTREGWKRNSKRRNRERIQIKAKIIEERGGRCERCGGEFDPCVYEFHHKDPSLKDLNPAEIFRYYVGDMNKIRKELEGCLLVCANCHKIIHKGHSLRYARDARHEEKINIQISFHF